MMSELEHSDSELRNIFRTLFENDDTGTHPVREPFRFQSRVRRNLPDDFSRSGHRRNARISIIELDNDSPTAPNGSDGCVANSNQENEDPDDEVIFVKEVRRHPMVQGLDDEVVIITDSREALTCPIQEEPNGGVILGANTDDEVEAVGVKVGVRPNIDYPHFRFDCGVHKLPLGAAARLHCDKCYCYVCDEPATKCEKWIYHSHANDKMPKWRRLRTAHRNRRNWLQDRRSAASGLPNPSPRLNGNAPTPNSQSEDRYSPSRYSSTVHGRQHASAVLRSIIGIDTR